VVRPYEPFHTGFDMPDPFGPAKIDWYRKADGRWDQPDLDRPKEPRVPRSPESSGAPAAQRAYALVRAERAFTGQPGNFWAKLWLITKITDTQVHCRELVQDRGDWRNGSARSSCRKWEEMMNKSCVGILGLAILAMVCLRHASRAGQNVIDSFM